MKLKDRLNSTEKFTFTLEFQTEVLRYLIQGTHAVLLVPKIKPGYFTLIEHSIISQVLVKFVKKHGKVPQEAVLFELVNELLKKKDYANLVIKEDIPNIQHILKDLYGNPLKDGDIIEDNIYKFIAYVELKSLNESMDFTNYSLYEDYQRKVSKILASSKPIKQEEPLYMVQGTTLRQLKRRTDPDIVPTPFWQLNKLGNGDGYPKNSIFVVLDKPKRRKTFALINVARGYLTQKKNVLYLDLENGKSQIMERMVQSTLNKSKKQLMTGDYDKLEQRHMRKYKRLGVEFIVERLPAMVSDCNDIRNLIQKLQAEKGIKISVLVIDYAAKLASISRDKDDVERINNVYIDLDNLGEEMDLDAIWTAQHVTRDAAKHQATRYEDNDIASAISIVRNAKCIIGLNSTEEEEEHNILRMEIVVQRDGLPNGRVMFNMNPETQRLKEFSKLARMKYDESIGQQIDNMMKKDKKHTSNPVADASKASRNTGDI